MSQAPDDRKKQMKTGPFGSKKLSLEASKALRDSIMRSSPPDEIIRVWRLNIDNEMGKGERKNVEFIKKTMRLIRKMIRKLSPQNAQLRNDLIEYLIHINRQLPQ